jgi:two-component system response regulator RegA
MKLERAAVESDADTLLIVENDTALLTQLRRAMEARGFTVRTASTESDAIALAREFAPRYALVDLRLEPGDGLAVVTALHLMHPACRAVIFSGYGNIPTAVSAVKAGAIDYLPKPADPDEIADALRAPSGGAAKPPEHPASPNAVRRQHILNVFAECDHKVSVTARRLGMHRRTLQRLLAQKASPTPHDDGGPAL